MRIGVTLLFAICLAKVESQPDLEEALVTEPAEFTLARTKTGPIKGAVQKFLKNRRTYSVSPAARLEYARKQLKKGAMLKTTWNKCIVRVNTKSDKCWMVQSNCRMRNRMKVAHHVVRMAKAMKNPINNTKDAFRKLGHDDTEIEGNPDEVMSFEEAEEEVQNGKSELKNSKKVRCFPKDRVRIEEMEDWSFPKWKRTRHEVQSIREEIDDEEEEKKRSKYRVVITKPDGSYRKKFINVSPTFADSLRLILDPDLAEKPEELTHDLEYGACVAMGDARAKQKAFLHMFLGLSSLLGFIPVAGGLISEVAADSIRSADALYQCEGILRDEQRMMSNEEYDAWMETDAYMVAFGGCLKKGVSRILALDNWDSVLSKIHSIATKSIKGFAGFITMPVAITMAVKDVLIAMAMAKVQYDHARAGYFVSCLHESVRTMDKDLLQVIWLMDQVSQAIDHKSTVHYALVYERLAAITRVVENRLEEKPMVVQQMVVENILPFVQDSEVEDGAETAVAPPKEMTFRSTGTKEFSMEQEFQKVEKSLVDAMGLSQKILDLLKDQSAKVAQITKNAEAKLSQRVRYYKAVESARTAEAVQFENRMYYVDIVRYPIDYVVKNIYNRVKKIKGNRKVAVQPYEDAYDAPALVRRAALPSRSDSLARIEKLAGLTEENGQMAPADLLEFLVRETETIRAVVDSHDEFDRENLKRAEKAMEHVKTVVEKLHNNELSHLMSEDEEVGKMIDASVQETEEICSPKTAEEAKDRKALEDFDAAVEVDDITVDLSDATAGIAAPAV